MDGVLIDGTEGMEESLRHVSLRELSDSEIRSFFSTTPLQKSFQVIFNMNDEDSMRYCGLYREYYKDGAYLKTKLYDGVIETLRFIKSCGIAIGIATFKRADYALKIADALGLSEFMGSVRAADAAGVLTKVDIIAQCMKDMDVAPTAAVYVGDTQNDFNSAKALGMDFIASLYGFGFTKNTVFNDAEPIAKLEKFGDILSLLGVNCKHHAELDINPMKN
jgi:phosphoglycolate phosphatase